MCLAIPHKIESINGNIAVVKTGKKHKEINTRLVSGVKKGDWILVNQSSAVSKITEEDALETLKLISEEV